ncbi:C40 family peptidase [Lutibacter sp.]
MHYGICNLSIVPLRIEPSDSSEMTSQILFGEHFKILEVKKNWCKIRIAFDNYEGWMDAKQFEEITEETFAKLETSELTLASEFIEFAIDKKENYITVPLGASLPFYANQNVRINTTNFKYDGAVISKKLAKKTIVNIAFKYLNTPYLWGGKTPFGMDCSGFTQMVYKLCGYKLLRDATQQATQGDVLSFIEESEPGDLAFFDNSEGIITHVGIIMKDNYIIHAYGKVRVDRIDHSGIFNIDTHTHTHKLRVIKKII